MDLKLSIRKVMECAPGALLRLSNARCASQESGKMQPATPVSR